LQPDPPTAPQLVSAVYTISTTVLVLEFDQAMDQTSLPISNGNLIGLNVGSVDRRGRLPLSWIDATHLSVQTTTTGAPVVPIDTTRCADTSGIESLGGVQAESWDLFPLTIVP
jgi:hypothetical protein